MLNSNLLKTLSSVGVLASIAVITNANPAQALLITVQENTPFSTVDGAKTITFDDAALGSLGGTSYDHESGVSYSGVGGNIVKNSVGGRYAALPTQGDYNKQDNPYLTVGSYGNKKTDILTINFGVDSDYFGFYFGSIDNYNNIKFFNGDELVVALTGSDIKANANGNQSISGARFVNFFAEAGENFDRIEFQSDGIAFETDNHAYRQAEPVPTPAAVLPILSGLFMSAKRRKKDSTEA
ncbi:MAG: PTPA-CTERM sorting domain-containing protein [Limnothrix sp. RL_2_0]|nr:PTPA-CTERM sorting domain-containing protein [Limnothrix sp. RL_2_0]